MFVVFTIVTLATLAKDNRFRGHVSKIDGKYEVVTTLAGSYEEPSTNVGGILATGSWNENYNTTGWSVLEIKTSENQTNVDQAYSAGLLEGQFTQGYISLWVFKSSILVSIELTRMQWQNTVADVCTHHKHFCTKLKDFLQIQLNWIYLQIDTHPNDEYWNQVYTREYSFLNTFFYSCR